MEGDKGKGSKGSLEESGQNPDNTTRARNKTVMLTPELTGQVRARLVGGQEALPEGTGDDDSNESPRGIVRNFGFAGPGGSESPGEHVKEEDDNDWTRPIGQDAEELEESEPAPAPLREMGWEPASRPSFQPPPSQLEAPITPAAERRASIISSPPTTPPATATLLNGHSHHEEVTSGNEQIVWRNKTQLKGFLVSYDNNELGDYVELRSGRLLITADHQATGNYFIIDDPSVSQMHAIMRVGNDGSIQVLDQLSEHGTRIKRAVSGEEELLSGEKAGLNHGDVLIFGERKFHVCLISGE